MRGELGAGGWGLRAGCWGLRAGCWLLGNGVVVEAEVREHRGVREARFDVRPIDKELIGRRDRWRGAFIPRRARGAAIAASMWRGAFSPALAGLKGPRHIDGWAGPCGPSKLGPCTAASTRFQFRP